MSDRIPKKWERVLRDLHARFPGKMAHEIVTEDGVFRLDDLTDDEWIEIVYEDDRFIEIVDDSDFIEIVEGYSMTLPCPKAQEARGQYRRVYMREYQRKWRPFTNKKSHSLFTFEQSGTSSNQQKILKHHFIP